MGVRRRISALAGAAAALSLVGAAALPGGTAAAYPRPLPGEWWFTQWGVTDHLWPQSQGDGVTVAVIDSGVQANLPELSGVVLPGTDLPGGGDGRSDHDTAAVAGHGTAMASLIAAQGGGTGFLGVAPKAKILPIGLPPDSNSQTAAAIRYATDHGAKVINISQGSPVACGVATQQAVGYAIQHDVVIVSSAGNTGDESNLTSEPANCAGVLAVGATDARNRPWAKTQRQPYVAVAAPGVATVGLLRDGQVHTSDGGTSTAGALTSGAVALIRSRYPDWTNRQVVQQVIGSALHIGSHSDRDGYGMIRPHRVLDGLVPKTGPNPVFDAYDKWAAANGRQPGTSGKPASEKTVTNPLSIVVAAVVGVVVIGAIAYSVVSGRRRKARGPYGPPPGQGYGPPPGQGYGPPQNYGPPQGHGAPSQQDQGYGPPPGQAPYGGRPQGPPPTFGPPR